MANWHRLGDVSPDDFASVRVVLHHAIRIVSAVAKDLVPPEEDASHKSLTYDADLGVFAGWYVPSPENVRAGLIARRFELALLDQDGEAIASLPLAGRTMAGATKWLNDEVQAHWKEAETFSLQEYRDLPPHPVEDGGRFPELERVHLETFERAYADSRLLLEEIQKELQPGPPIRIWPHHFDQALLIPYGLGADGEARSVGLGFSPGDVADPRPYLYVTPWPYPPPEKKPAEEGPGRWQTEPWFGARLDLEELQVAGDRQEAIARTFLEGAHRRARELLGV